MRRNALWLFGLILATGLLAAGCGNDDDTETEEALSKSEYVAQANAICAQGNQEIDQAFQELSKNSSQADFDQVVTETVIPSISGQIDDLRALGVPEGDEDQVDAFLASAQETIDKVEADPGLLNDEQGEDPFADTEQQLREYGITKCG